MLFRSARLIIAYRRRNADACTEEGNFTSGRTPKYKSSAFREFKLLTREMWGEIECANIEQV